MQFIADFFLEIYNFINSIPDIVNDLLIKSAAWFLASYLEMKIYFITFSWSVAVEILNQLNISGQIDTYWNSMDSDVMGVLTHFKVPEALNMILNAHLTRYVMGVIK